MRSEQGAQSKKVQQNVALENAIYISHFSPPKEVRNPLSFMKKPLYHVGIQQCTVTGSVFS